jgi:hypothetical protein
LRLHKPLKLTMSKIKVIIALQNIFPQIFPKLIEDTAIYKSQIRKIILHSSLTMSSKYQWILTPCHMCISHLFSSSALGLWIQ